MILWRIKAGGAVCGLVSKGNSIVRYAPYIGKWAAGKTLKEAIQGLRESNAKIEIVEARYDTNVSLS